MLHYDFCAFSFLELLDWIKPCVEITWKIWRTKEIDWGPSQVFPMLSTRPPHHFWCEERKSPNPTRFGCWIRTAFGCWIQTAGQNQVVTAATTSYGLRFGSSWTLRKAYKVYFHMDLDSCPYLLRGGCNRWFTTKIFSVHGAASPNFGPMGCVWSRAQQGRVLGFRDDLHHVLIILYPFIYLHSHHKQIEFCFVESLAIATCL
jgi:hypothetical protein